MKEYPLPVNPRKVFHRVPGALLIRIPGTLRGIGIRLPR